jgi:hypothetical protein
MKDGVSREGNRSGGEVAKETRESEANEGVGALRNFQNMRPCTAAARPRNNASSFVHYCFEPFLCSFTLSLVCLLLC